jgi:DinB superfamily
MDPQQIDAELRRAQAEFHQLLTTASPADLQRQTDGTRWTNRQLLFHIVLGYGIVRTLLPLVRTLGRLGHSLGFAATLNAGRRPFHWINYLGPCVAARLLTPRAISALLDRTIGSLRHRLAAETERTLALSMHMPTDWDPYFTPTMSVLDVYHFGTQHFDHHRRQLTLLEPNAQP